jgi:cobalt/nickel transport system ATP-binding protein
MAVEIEVTKLNVRRENDLDRETRLVIRDLSLTIAPGERVAIAGANGAGKTSLLLALVGALAFEGRIRVGQDDLGPRTLEDIRQRVGFVFAEPADQLFLRTVREEVELGPRLRRLGEVEVRQRGDDALKAVGLSDFEARSPSSLSLGEQRRLAVAAVLSIHADALLLDEPTASLDGRARRDMLAAIRGTGATTLFATHDLDAALELDARVVLLSEGALVADGPARELLSDAATLDRAGLELPISVRALRDSGRRC